ncbi:protease II [Planoprotostelium fungivorum]|uniref:Prolyl endopeptidase n=1 Tax=Planoprotostelium fungivorum TaxID=1890364 RepID=A0A2P6ND59_9EUKA|nr:protease II [Planoprotostelium fungivorum]
MMMLKTFSGIKGAYHTPFIRYSVRPPIHVIPKRSIFPRWHGKSPLASKIPTHNDLVLEDSSHRKLTDDFQWLKDKDSRKVQDYIDLENRYTQRRMSEQEFKSKEKFVLERLKEYDEGEVLNTAPEIVDGYSYFTIQHKDAQFSTFVRTDPQGQQQVVLDLDKESVGEKYIGLGVTKTSVDHKYLAYTLDTEGESFYSLYVRDIDSGQRRKLDIGHVSNIEWNNEGDCIVYSLCDHHRRPHEVWVIHLGTEEKKRLLVEKDPSCYIDIISTKDREFITINSSSKNSSEIHMMSKSFRFEHIEPLDASDEREKASSASPSCVLVRRREEDVEYYMEHMKGLFYMITNRHGMRDYGVMTTTRGKGDWSEWKSFFPSRESVKVEDVDILQNHLVLYERENGRCRVKTIELDEPHSASQIEPREPLGMLQPGVNMDPYSDKVRFSNSSLVTPEATYDYDVTEKKLTLLHEAADGACVPMTVAHRSDMSLNGRNPLLLMGYGAYGEVMENSFQENYHYLLSRGWVVALAHVRGGGEKGDAWHRAGSLMNKMNSHRDFISCALHCVQSGYTSHDIMSAMTSSAGGLMLATAINERPDLFRAVILKVPFTEVVTSMTDKTLALTEHEHAEWGDPLRDAKTFDYMRAYDPYQDEWPHMWVTASLLDDRVPFWMPLRYVAKLRHHLSPELSRRVLLTIDRDTGHFGDGGREERRKERSKEIAFLFESLGFQ